MENMNTVMRSCLKSTSSCFLVAEEDIADFLQFLGEKFPDMTRYDNMLEEHVCPYGTWALDSMVNMGLKEYTLNSIPSPSILTM